MIYMLYEQSVRVHKIIQLNRCRCIEKNILERGKKMKKIANIYVRSCAEEVNKNLKESRLVAQKLGVYINMECVDINKSAHDHDRAGYQRLIADIKQEKIQVIIVGKFEKFHRDTIELIKILRLAELHQVKIFLLDENKFYTDNLSDVKTLRAFAFNESKKWL